MSRPSIQTSPWPALALMPALTLALLLPLGGCARPAERESHAEAAKGPAEEPAPDRVAVGELRGVRFEPAGSPRQEGAWFAAEAMVDPVAAAAFASPVSGLVTGLLVRPGQAVKAGAAL